MGFFDKIKEGAKKAKKWNQGGMARKTYVVRYTGNSPNPWAIFTGKQGKPVLAVGRKTTAKRRAISKAKKHKPSKVVIENKDGGIVDIREYGEAKKKTKTGKLRESLGGIESDVADIDRVGENLGTNEDDGPLL